MWYQRIEHELHELSQRGALRRLKTLPHTGLHIQWQGRNLLNLTSNDYLGLATRLDLRQEFFSEQAIDALMLGSGSSRLLTGHYPVVEELEECLATSFDRQAALVFNSGYHMNTGILPAVAQSGTLIVADKLVHASLIDGIKLSGAPFLRFRHNDLSALKQILAQQAHQYEAVIVVIESLYSMDGDLADLPALVNLKKQYPQVLLYVDEAHAIGVRGHSGLGWAQETNTIADIDFLCGTFGKALGGMGGYMICQQVVKDYLVNRSRSLIYSTALPPLVYAWATFIIKRLHTFVDERRKLAEQSAQMRQMIASWGYPMPSASQIIPLVAGTNEAAIKLSDALAAAGYYAPAVRPPTVPAGSSRLRLSLTADTPIEALCTSLRSVLDV